MSENKICQSCGVLMINAADFGINIDGSISQDFCQECFRTGQFTNPTLTRDLVQQKIAQR